MKTDWYSCDGLGGQGEAPVSRRAVLRMGAAATAFWAAMSPAWSQAVMGDRKKTNEVLVVVFLRGGADMLHVVPPYAEDEYLKARPSLGIKKDVVLDLDGHFGFHPAMKSLHPAFHAGHLGIVHAVGSGDTTHSHFEAMATMEAGRRGSGDSAMGGWLARYIQATPDTTRPLRAVSWGGALAESLNGASALGIGSLNDLVLDPPSHQWMQTLSKAYQEHDDLVSATGRHLIDVTTLLKRLDPANAKPEKNAQYPKTATGDALREAAFLIRQDVGLQIACIDSGGWDSHVAQSYLEGQMRDLSDALSAFTTDMGQEMNRVTVVVMSEFGRRVSENSGLGTDHGTGGAMFVLGAGVKGGKVYGRWPGVAPQNLVGPGDLAITTDYRAVLSEVLEKRFAFTGTGQIFSGLGPERLGLIG